MEVPGKPLVVGILVVGIVAYAFGRYSTPEKIKIETKIVEVEKKTETKQEDTKTKTKKAKKYVKTTTETTAPDGTKTSTTTINVDTSDGSTTNTKSSDSSTEIATKDTNESKEITGRKSALNLGFMVGPDLSHGLNMNTMVYGGYANKALIGPITTGIYGLSNGSFGFTLGISY